MAQNDTHVALIILTAQMWGGGLLVEKNFGPKFVFWRLWRQHPFLHKTKGPTRNPISPTPPPPPPSAGVHAPPPPPPQSNFQVANCCFCPLASLPSQHRFKQRLLLLVSSGRLFPSAAWAWGLLPRWLGQLKTPPLGILPRWVESGESAMQDGVHLFCHPKFRLAT